MTRMAEIHPELLNEMTPAVRALVDALVLQHVADNILKFVTQALSRTDVSVETTAEAPSRPESL